MEYDRLGQFNRNRFSLIVIITTLSLYLAFSLSSVLASDPTAGDDSYSATEDTTLIVAAPGVLGNDTPITATAVLDSGPFTGTLDLSSSGAFTYTPVLDFNGPVTFTYHAYNGITPSNTAVVTITVAAINDPPVAANDSYTTSEDITLTVSLPGVLTNDTDVDGGALSAVDPSVVSDGELSLSSDGSFIYTPTLDYNGPVTFTYFVTDTITNSLSAATVIITVTAVNDDPVLATNAGLTVYEGQTMTITSSLLQATDVDNSDTAINFVLDTTPVYGLLKRDGVTLSLASAFTQEDINQNRMTYSHDGSEPISDDSFDFAVSDGSGGSIMTTTFSIVITPTNDLPIVVADADTTAEDTAVATNVLANDSDIDGNLDPATVTVTVSPGNGSTSVNLTTGFITYTPTLNFNGNDSYTYEACDNGTPLPPNCVSATVALTITAVNDPPTAYDDGDSTDEDTPLNVSADGVLTNDTDPDTGEGDTKTVTIFDGTSANGATVSVNPDGSYSYDPTGSGTLNALAVTESIIDSFAYTMRDAVGVTDTATVTITVSGVNDAPTANADSGATDEDNILTVVAPGVLVNDTDPDTTDTLTVGLSDSASANGAAVSISADGSYSYDPTGAAALQAIVSGGSLVDTFVYTTTDSHGGNHATTVAITVTGVNDAPTLDNTGDMTLSNINEDDITNTGELVISIIASALGDRITDADAGATEGIAVVGVDDANGVWQYSINNGTDWFNFGAVSNIAAVLLDASGGTSTRIRFVPDSNYNGSAGNVTFRAWDQTTGSNGATGVDVSGSGGATAYSSNTETATLTVSSVNDAPVLDNSGSMFLTNILEDAANSSGDTVVSIIASAGGDRITDVDAGSVEGVAVTGVDNSNGVWQYSTNNGNTWNDLVVAETSATLLNPQAKIRYVPNANYYGSAGNVTFRAWDQTTGFNGETGVNVSSNGGATPYSLAAETASLTVVSVNDAPSLDLNGAGSGTGFFPTFTEDGGAVVIVDTDLTATDVDHTNLFSATATLTNLQDGAAESLAVNTGGTSINASYNSANGVLALTGSDSVANYQTVLRTLTYNNSSEDPTTSARVVEIVVNDGVDDSNTANSIITVNAVNDAPLLDTNAGLTVNEGGSGPITNSRLTVTDVDNPTTDLVYTVETIPAHGDLLLNGSILPPAGTFTQDDVDNNRLDYAHDGSETTSDSFSFSVADGKGGTIGTTPFNFTINANNDAPVLVTNTGLTEDEGGSVTITNSQLKATDTDNTAGQLTYRVEIAPVNGSLKLSGVPLSMNDTFTQDDVDNSRVSYAHNGSETASDNFTFAVEDGAGGYIDSTLFNITINPVNDVPIVDLNGSSAGVNYAAAAFVEDGGAVPIVASDLSLTDADHTNMASATATLTNHPDGAAESLSVSIPVTSTIGASYNTATGVLTLTGPDTVANFQTVLRSLTYNNTSQDPDVTTRTVNVVVNDGAGNSATTMSSIDLTALNDAPLLATNAGATVDAGKSVTITNLELQITDVDNQATELVYTISAIPAHGQLKLNGAPLTVGNTFTQDDIDNNRLTYTHDDSDTESDSFSFTATDGAGGTIDTTMFDLVIVPKPLVFLPVVLNNFIYSEPNNTACEAYGLSLNQSYQFLPDDQEDWYLFTLNATSNLTIQVTNYAPPDGQLILYTGASCTSISQVANGHNPDISPSGSITLNSQPAGTYYVRVYTASVPSNPTFYTLRVQSP